MSRLIPPTQFPPPHPSDPEPVGWALCTAAALWKAGRYGDSVAWIQKAASNAAALAGDAADSNVRVVELTIAATELGHYVRKWEHGDDDADPASIPVSTDFQEIDLEIESIPAGPPPAPVRPGPGAPRGMPGILPAAGRAPLPPRARAETLQQDHRDAVVPRAIPVAPRPTASAPRVVMKGKRAMLSTTLPEAVPVPSVVKRQPPPSTTATITATEELHGPPTSPLRLDFENSILGQAPASPKLAPHERRPPSTDPTPKEAAAPPSPPASQVNTVVAPDVLAGIEVGGTLPGAAFLRTPPGKRGDGDPE